jgi:hypothetical protein
VSDSDYEAGPVLVPDPDPTGSQAEADTVGVPAGSASPTGESDFVDGVENPGDSAGLGTEQETTED